MIEEFHSKEELYKRVYPALSIKVKELKEKQITEKMIWDSLSLKWKNSKNLTLFDIVDDIFKYEIEETKTEGEQYEKE